MVTAAAGRPLDDVAHRAPGNPTGASAPHRMTKLASLIPVRGRWLDVGCGAGDYTQLLPREGASFAVGIDLGLRHPLLEDDTDAFCTAASERLPFADDVFAGALLNEVLEHVDDEQATLVELRRVVRPGGYLVVFSPNRWFPFEGHGAVFGRHEIDAPVPLMPWLPLRFTKRWMRARNYWPRDLRERLERAGFIVERLEFAYPLFVAVHWLPEPWARRVRGAAPRLERARGLRRFGVSTMLVARVPVAPSAPPSGVAAITPGEEVPAPLGLRRS